MKKLYIGNLSPETSEPAISQFFEKFGPVLSCNLIRDRFTKVSKCYAFVELEDEQSARQAIEELDQAVLEGSEVKVNEARPKEEATDTRGASTGGESPNRFGIGRSFDKPFERKSNERGRGGSNGGGRRSR